MNIVGYIEEVQSRGVGSGSGIVVDGIKYGVYDPTSSGLDSVKAGMEVNFTFKPSTDGRFKNEVDEIKNAGGTTIRVNRGQDPEWLTDAVDYNYYKNPQALARLTELGVHASEYSSVGLDYDHTIDNNGTIDDLHKHMELIVNS